MGRKILIQKMDVKSAFRQVRVDPTGAVNFGHVLGDYLFIDLRLQFGWRASPGGGEWQLVPSNRRSDRRHGHQRLFWTQELRLQRMSGSQSKRG